MVQLTLSKVDRVQKNKRNLDTMTLSDSDDERNDKEDRYYEHDDEGSLYAESTGDATECADDDNTGNKTKKTTAAAAAAAAVAKPRKKRSETS
jgi:hypothetical protein